MDRIKGVARPDPTRHRDGPLIFKVSALRFHQQFKEDHGVLPLGTFRGSVLSMSFRDDYGHHTLGSSVMVGPGLALCATHVLNDFMPSLTAGNASLVFEAPNADSLELWLNERVSIVPDSDLSVLSMSLNSSFPASMTIHTAAMTTRMPLVGEELILCGFQSLVPTQPKKAPIEIGGNLRYARGKVLEVFEHGRDRVMLPAATIAVACSAVGGMSGGPVFDQRGYLVGTVASGTEGDCLSYVSHLWPALVRARAEPVWPHGLTPDPATLLQLGQRFSVHIERPDAFELCIHDGAVSLNYRAWS